MCSPCGPMVCYKYEDCGPPKGRATESSKLDNSDDEKKGSKENQLKRTKSRELRGGIMYYSCHCIKRNGLQHDCRRTGCGGEPACLVLPDPVCAPSQLARARGLADPEPFVAHLRNQAGSSENDKDYKASLNSGKRFIVCELKGVLPDAATNKKEMCCKCSSLNIQVKDKHKLQNDFDQFYNTQSLFYLDQITIDAILDAIHAKELDLKGSSSYKNRSKIIDNSKINEVCSRPGCVHWKPPPPCSWDLPCKADCFETPPGILSSQNRGGFRKNN